MSVEQPMLSDLMAAYLRRLAAGPQSGLVSGADRDVEPYDAVPTQVLDPVQTWSESTLALQALGLDAPSTPPAVWPAIVLAAQASTAVPMAAGQFPQSVRDLSRLARSVEAGTFEEPKTSPVTIDGLDSWISETTAKPSVAGYCVAAGVLRRSHRFDEAGRLLAAAEKMAGKKEQPAIANERATELWERGRHAEALGIWRSAPTSIPVTFNLGMSALFTGDKKAALAALQDAIDAIDDTSG